MLWLLLGVASLFIGFSLYSRRFSNPNTLTFLFGKKGSGKSTYMVKLMLRDLRRGWTVYTNMDDVVIPGVRVFDADGLKTCVPDEHSALYIDEAGLIWEDRGFKSFDKGFTEFFKYQRKYKCKMVINSQAFDVDKKIRVLTDTMALQTNVGNVIGVTRPIIRSITLTEPTADNDSRIADRLRFAPFWQFQFTFMPRYFKYFDSFEAPKRPPLPFREIGEAVSELEAKSVKKALKISLGGSDNEKDI